jgi:hypothetical protein
MIMFSLNLFSQFSRTDGMGSLSFSIVDKDLSLSPYDFGGNPAGLYHDEKESILKMGAYGGNDWGKYRRKYDAEGTMNAGASFREVKTLGEHGTFLGSTSYNYENRRNYYRSLKKDMYTGESFFFTDTTAADFRYMGPNVALTYSLELADNICAGVTVSYQLLEGLKKQFSFAKSIYRNTELQAGLTYAPFERVMIGGSVEYFDSQESIEASDVNLLDVELYYFRGDNLFVSKRSSSMTGNIKKKGIAFGSQLFWDNGDDISVGIQANYMPSDSKLLKPFSSSAQSFDEVEDSYAAFEFSDVQLKSQYKCSDDLLLGIFGGYDHEYSWSKISLKNLLIWEWDVTKYRFGAGSSYQLNSSLLAGFEYEIASANADSSKYIDNKIVNRTSVDHTIRVGAEYKVSDDIFLRAGFNYGFMDHDLVYGGDRCTVKKITWGAGFPVTEAISVDAQLQYRVISPESPANIIRTYINGIISIQLAPL